MDYTSTDRVKRAIHANEDPDDQLISDLVTAASRALDKKCAGSPDAEDYFVFQTVADEYVKGLVNKDGSILVFPHKSVIDSVISFSYRFNPRQNWQTVDPQLISIAGRQVVAWANLSARGSVDVKITYEGGYGTTIEELPADFVEAVTLLAARYYREDESGVSDAIGVAELGTVMYTKAMPVRVLDLIRPYTRPVPW